MVEKYVFETMSYQKLKAVISTPKFQRNLVWSLNKRKMFIDTLRNGYPFGSILIWKKSEDKYLLVDGLQRFSTVKSFEEKRHEYIDFSEVEEYIEKIFLIIQELMPLHDTQKEKIRFIVKKTIAHTSIDSKLPTILTKQLTKEFVVLNENVESVMNISEIFSEIVTKMEKEIDLAKLYFPVIIFNGKENELPKIFDRLNRNGVQLSKYEIYASTWSNIELKIRDHQILDWIEKKYKQMVSKSDIEIEGYDEGAILESCIINLFEYCCALGKVIKEKYSSLFPQGNSTDAASVDSIGFAIISALLCNSVKKMEGIPEYINSSTDEKSIINLKDKILECAEKIENTLKPFLFTPDGKNCAKYIETQIVSMISNLFLMKYRIENDLCIRERENSKKHVKKYLKNIPMYYLFDIIRDYWSGSGDSKLDNELSLDNYENNRYMIHIDKEAWMGYLGQWFNEYEQKESMNISTESKLFLNYIYKNKVPEAKYSGMKFDVEHIIPKVRLKQAFDKPLGVSAVGNLCFLPVDENRSKKDKTLYERQEELSVFWESKPDVIQDLCYPEKDEIQFIESAEGFTFENYKTFLKNRQNYLINLFNDCYLNNS